MGATCPREFAVPTAPQAGLNNRTASSHTLSPAEKKQAVPALLPVGAPRMQWHPSALHRSSGKHFVLHPAAAASREASRMSTAVSTSDLAMLRGGVRRMTFP